MADQPYVCPRCGTESGASRWCSGCGLNLALQGDLPTREAFEGEQSSAKIPTAEGGSPASRDQPDLTGGGGRDGHCLSAATQQAAATTGEMPQLATESDQKGPGERPPVTRYLARQSTGAKVALAVVGVVLAVLVVGLIVAVSFGGSGGGSDAQGGGNADSAHEPSPAQAEMNKQPGTVEESGGFVPGPASVTMDGLKVVLSASQAAQEGTNEIYIVNADALPAYSRAKSANQSAEAFLQAGPPILIHLHQNGLPNSEASCEESQLGPSITGQSCERPLAFVFVYDSAAEIVAGEPRWSLPTGFYPNVSPEQLAAVMQAVLPEVFGATYSSELGAGSGTGTSSTESIVGAWRGPAVIRYEDGSSDPFVQSLHIWPLRIGQVSGYSEAVQGNSICHGPITYEGQRDGQYFFRGEEQNVAECIDHSRLEVAHNASAGLSYREITNVSVSTGQLHAVP